MTLDIDDFLIAQYEQCYQSWIAHNNAIWQTPAIAGVISSGLTLGAFTYAKNIVVLEVTLASAWILTFILLIALIKHRYFSNIEQETLCEIEDALKAKRIQRPTEVQKKIEYWHTKEPHCLETLSAYIYLKSGMIVLLGVISILIISPLFFK
jgi:hypothetical protein